MLKQINQLEQKIIEKLSQIKDENELVNYRNDIFGKN